MTEGAPGGRSHPDSGEAPVSFDRLSLAGAALSFTLLGAVESVYGPLVQAIHDRFGVSVPVAGLTLTVHFVGAVVGVVAALFLVRRVAGRQLVMVAAMLAACGSTVVAIAHSWVEFGVGVGVTGVGFGILDLMLNQLVARTRRDGRAGRLTFMNGLFGLGALAGPLFVSWVTPAHFGTLFGCYAVAAGVVVFTMRGLAAPPSGPTSTATPRAGGRRVARGGRLALADRWRRVAARALGVERRGILGAFLVGFLVYVAAESSASGWIAASLHAVGYPATEGALVTTGFWAGMTTGRFVSSWLGRFVRERSFVVGGLALALVFVLATRSSSAAPVFYPLAGLALAPVYPMALSWYSKLERSAAYGVPLLLVASVVGGVIGPATQSVAVSSLGFAAVPTVTALLVAIDLCIFAGAVVTRSAPS